MDDAIATGRIERFYGNQLVVDVGDRRLVERELTGLGVTNERIDEDDRLGLARLELPRLVEERDDLLRRARVAEGEPDPAVEHRVDQAIEQARRNREQHDPSSKLPELDLLLVVLRARFAQRYDGWSPTIGKHRVVELAKGYPHLGGGSLAALGADPHLGGGGSGDPEPVDPPDAFTLDASELAKWAQIGRGIRVAILDTGLWQHPFLVGRFIAPPGTTVTATPHTIPPWASAGHATFVSGLVLARAPGAQLEVHGVLDERAIGDAWDAARKIAEVAASGVHIINLSWGCHTDDGQAPLVLARAVDRLAPEIVVVASVGNHADIDKRLTKRFPGDEGLTPETPIWPAAFDRVTAVGATDAGEIASFSPRTPWVDLLAPGVDVESTYLTGEVRSRHVEKHGDGFDFVEVLLPKSFKTGFAEWSGTSFAAAAVSGQLAADATSVAGGVPQALERLRSPSYGSRPGSDIRAFTEQDLER
jgi:membrane-anchored mycosin MYCP